jgi:hypothetical protein
MFAFLVNELLYKKSLELTLVVKTFELIYENETENHLNITL